MLKQINFAAAVRELASVAAAVREVRRTSEYGWRQPDTDGDSIATAAVI